MKRKRIINQIMIVLVVLGVLTLSVGYSAFGANLSIEEMVANVKSDYVGITGFVPVSQTIEDDTINQYQHTNNTLSANLSLTNENSKVTFEIETTIYMSEAYGIGIYEITGLPDNLEYQLNDYELKKRICNNNGECRYAVQKKFYITIQYKENGFQEVNTNYAINLNVDFRKVYEILYQNIDYAPILPKEIIENDVDILSIELEEGSYEVNGKVASSINENVVSLLLAEGNVSIIKK